MFRPQKTRVRRAIDNAADMARSWSSDRSSAREGLDPMTHLHQRCVVAATAECVVTELGFVTMAVLPQLASRLGNQWVIPGADDDNQHGFLVLTPNAVPYHSQAATPALAAHEAAEAASRAADLVHWFGGKASLRLAARTAPWYLMVRTHDIPRAGLCAWGSASFLKRFGLTWIAKNVGLPRIALCLTGAYGDRLTATVIRRKACAGRVNDIPTGLDSQRGATVS